MSKLQEILDLQFNSIEKLTQILSGILDQQQDITKKLHDLQIRQEQYEEQTRQALLSLAQR